MHTISCVFNSLLDTILYFDFFLVVASYPLKLDVTALLGNFFVSFSSLFRCDPILIHSPVLTACMCSSY